MFDTQDVFKSVTWTPTDTALGLGAQFVDLKGHAVGFRAPSVSLREPSVDREGHIRALSGRRRVHQAKGPSFGMGGSSFGLFDPLVGVRWPPVCTRGHFIGPK